MIVVLILLFILTISQIMSTLALSWLIRAQREDRVDHAKCIAAVAAFVGDEFAASVLEAAAADYTSMNGQAELARIVNTVWGPDQSVPALWLQDRADRIRNHVASGN